MILIGSRALALRAPLLLQRKPLDFDFVCTKPEFDSWLENNISKLGSPEVYEMPEFHKWIVKGSSICEFEIITPCTSSELLVDLVNADKDTIDTPFGKIPSVDLLFTIKDSHKYKKFNFQSNGFWKTTIDWHMMNHVGAKVRPEYAAFHKLRKAEAYAGQKHPKLNVSKDNFFKDDGLEYKYDHDSLHESVKLFDRPAYTYYLKDNEPVLCDKNKFFSVSEDIRLAGGVEEGLTLALERSLIPHDGVWSPDQAFKFACAKVASSITSGFFREYCFNNIFNILKLYNNTSKNYYEKFKEDVKTGLVKPFTGTKY